MKIKLEPLPRGIIRTMVTSGTIYTRKRSWKYEKLFWAVALTITGILFIIASES